MSIKAMGL